MPPRRKKTPKAKPAEPAPRKASVTTLLPPIKPADEHLNLDDKSYEIQGKSWTERAAIRLGKLFAFETAIGDDARNETVIKFLKNQPGISKTEDDDDAVWEPVRFLGAGAYGRVGLWNKTSKEGKTLDTVAVKEMDRADAAGDAKWEPANPKEPRLPREVAINRDINIKDATHSTYVRGYKFGTLRDRGRMFMRPYEHGDVDFARRMYMIYGWFLPEWYIWSFTLDMCDSLEAMDSSPPADTKYEDKKWRGRKKPKYAALKTAHKDIKPGNIFLDINAVRKAGSASRPEAPTAVMGDFGEGVYTGNDDPGNPTATYAGGTSGYRQPETLTQYWQMPGVAKYPKTITGKLKNPKPLAPTPMNVWGIGRVVFEMMTHITGDDFGQVLKRNSMVSVGSSEGSDTFAGYVATTKLSTDVKFLKDKLLTPVIDKSLANSWPYSQELLELVSEMVHPDPAKRPTLKDLRKRAKAGLEKAIAANDEEKKQALSADKRKPWSANANSLGALCYKPEHFVNIPTGPIKWGQDLTHKEMEWLHKAADNVLKDWNPEAPKPRRPSYINDPDKIHLWARRNSDKLRVQDMVSDGAARNANDFLVHFPAGYGKDTADDKKATRGKASKGGGVAAADAPEPARRQPKRNAKKPAAADDSPGGEDELKPKQQPNRKAKGNDKAADDTDAPADNDDDDGDDNAPDAPKQPVRIRFTRGAQAKPKDADAEAVDEDEKKQDDDKNDEEVAEQVAATKRTKKPAAKKPAAAPAAAAPKAKGAKKKAPAKRKAAAKKKAPAKSKAAAPKKGPAKRKRDQDDDGGVDDDDDNGGALEEVDKEVEEQKEEVVQKPVGKKPKRK